MDLLLVIIRFGLALVFLIAGIAKLADLAGSRQAMRDFGVPSKLADLFGFLLPLAELAVSIALVLPLTALWGAVGALALLLIFVAGIGYNLAHGRTPDCHCFGQLHSAPAGWPTLMRNVALAAGAGVLVALERSGSAHGGLELFAQTTIRHKFELVGGAFVLILLAGEGWLLIQMMTQQGRLLLRIEDLENQLGMGSAQTPRRITGLPVGTPAPNFQVPTLDGETTDLKTLREGTKALLLLFSDPNCGPCTALLPDVAKWQRHHREKMHVALISRGAAEANRAKTAEPGVTSVLLQKNREIAQAYQAFGTPSAVVVDQDGAIGSPVAQGADAIRALAAAILDGTLPGGTGNGVVAAARRLPTLKIGQPAPDFSLPDLGGRTVRLSDFRGKNTLLLFWRPSCGFCARMLPELKAWEANKAANGAPELLIVSTDTLEANTAMGLRSTILLDNFGMSVGRQFGATGTPMAVLVDETGRIASGLVAGAQAVLALAMQGNSVTEHV